MFIKVKEALSVYFNTKKECLWFKKPFHTNLLLKYPLVDYFDYEKQLQIQGEHHEK
jgi:hypothetical protein